MARARMIWRAETQKVQAGNRPRAHRKNVAQDAANARRRALKRLDEGGVVVALHLEDAGLPIADVDDAGIFARPLDDPRRLGGKFAQVNARGFVGTMLVPHRRENAELGECRRAADERKDALVFVRLQAMRGNELGGDFGVDLRRQWSSGTNGLIVDGIPKQVRIYTWSSLRGRIGGLLCLLARRRKLRA